MLMRRGLKRIEVHVPAEAAAEWVGVASVTVKPAEVTPGSAASRAGKTVVWTGRVGAPGRITSGGGFYGWSIKHNVQETAEGAGSPG
jgi:hypothetical protein